MKNLRPRYLALALAALPAVLLLSAAGSSPPAPNLATAKAVDLTHPFDEKAIYWPTSPTSFALTKLSEGPTPGGWFYSSNSFCSPEHGGTHLDAPYHFSEKGATAERVPLSRLIAPAVVVDVRAKTSADADYRLARPDVEAWEKVHGRVPAGAIVLLRTGWSARWPDKKLYLGDDRPGDASNLHFPSFGEEAARFLIADRRAAAIGVDTASIDYGPSKDFPVHRLAGANDVPGFENVANLERVPETGAWVVALPMMIAGGSGGPLRIVALVP